MTCQRQERARLVTPWISSYCILLAHPFGIGPEHHKTGTDNCAQATLCVEVESHWLLKSIRRMSDFLDGARFKARKAAGEHHQSHHTLRRCCAPRLVTSCFDVLSQHFHTLLQSIQLLYLHLRLEQGIGGAFNNASCCMPVPAQL